MSALTAWSAALLASLQASAVTAVPRVTATWGSGTTWVPPTYYFAKDGSLGVGGPNLGKDESGRIHYPPGITWPNYVPDDWTLDDLQQLESDLPESIAQRQKKQVDKGEDSGHQRQLGREWRLLRQIKKKLSGS